METPHSDNQKWVDSWRKKLQKRKTISVLHFSKPLEYDNGMGETPCELTKPRIAPNNFKIRYWCKKKLAQQRGMQFYQTRSHAMVLCNTLPAICIEKALCVKTQEELYQKVRLTPRLPRVVLKVNSHSGQQDLRSQDARSSWDPPNESKSYGETWNNAVDYRIPGIHLLTFEQQDTTRENNCKKLIEKFENNQHKESFLQDLSQTQKINYSAEPRRI